MASELPASQSGPCATTLSRQGSASSQVSVVQSRTTSRSSCQAVGSPVTLPTMKPISGQPIRQVKASRTV